ncbi:LysR family transcriptional regulator [Vibrio sp. DW001]|uniref:LysR family transcriptional regulator n=1 Tax=Vibrio sp. DW001 TaxID=2912315 RepID=UPI0023B183F2|nr:LysR family transcriptional regulator [Vibrio sp. DW001]WED29432.1 LysR family transcriptional regulator [Vibrio sp. DW001]
MYSIEQLRMFVEAAELGSFSASARKLGKVQSAVSQGINNLEIDSNIQLFDRSTRKPTLTREGRHLFKQAKAVILQVESLSDLVTSINSGEEDIIRIALDDSFFMPSLFQILDRFSERFPATEIELISIASTDVKKHLKDKRADLGLMYAEMSFSQEIEACFIGNVNFKAVCHPGHPLASLSKVQLVDVIPHRQLMLRGDNGCFLEQFPPAASKIWWVNSFNAMKHTVVNGTLGWAYLPYHQVEQEVSEGVLVELNITIDHKMWCPPVDMVTLNSIKKGPALCWLQTHLKDVLEPIY